MRVVTNRQYTESHYPVPATVSGSASRARFRPAASAAHAAVRTGSHDGVCGASCIAITAEAGASTVVKSGRVVPNMGVDSVVTRAAASVGLLVGHRSIGVRHHSANG